jgi:hypothetical protein
MPPTLALARKARDANKKLLEKAHLTYTAMVKRRGKDVPAVIAFFESRKDTVELPDVLRVGRESVPLVVKIGPQAKPENQGG